MELIHGDCLKEMFDIPDNSIDMVCCDMPYGTTACKWDTVLPLDMLWYHYKRICRDNAAIVLFGAEPFSSVLKMSNIKNYKYDWIWQKDKSANPLNAKKMPLRRSENISVFYERQCLYKPQLVKKDPKNIRPPATERKQSELYGSMTTKAERQIPNDMSYPNETLFFNRCNGGNKDKTIHPTQKPVALVEYLIKTYTNKGDMVLDHCMGSGTTGVACKNLGRDFVGIELDKKYFDIAKQRIESHEAQGDMFEMN